MQKEEKIVRGADLATTGQKIKSYVLEQIADKQDTIDTVNVSVDNTTGTPSASASISGGIMNFAFSGIKGATGPQGQKGDQGDPGSSVDYPFTLANNLTEPDSTKALAAPQGKVLDEKISQLGLKVGEVSYDETLATPTWIDDKYVKKADGSLDTNTANKVAVIDCTNARRVRFIGFYSKTDAWVSGYAFYDSSDNVVHSYGWDYGASVNGSKEYDLEVPEGAATLKVTSWVSRTYNQPLVADFYCYVLSGKTVMEEIESLKEATAALYPAVFTGGYEQIAGASDITAQTQWYSLNATNATISTNLTYGYKGMMFPCKKGDKFIISTYGGTGGGRSYAIANSNGKILEVASTSQTDFITTPLSLTVTQSDAAMLYVNCLVSDPAYLYAFYVKKYGDTNRITLLEDKFKNNLAAKGILLLGASFSYSGNVWFANACDKLGVNGINQSVSGSSILNDANRLINGELFTDIEDFDILAIMHVLNYTVTNLGDRASYTWQDYEADADFVAAAQNDTRSSEWLSCAFDYVLKKYAYLCYQRKEVTTSKWYGTPYGKPVIVAICSSWHDVRQYYNNSAKALCEKWGYHFIDIASQIGFSCQTLSPATGEQPSIMYAHDTQSVSFTMGEQTVTQTVGWHPLRSTTNTYTQDRISEIFANEVAKLFY